MKKSASTVKMGVGYVTLSLCDSSSSVSSSSDNELAIAIEFCI